MSEHEIAISGSRGATETGGLAYYFSVCSCGFEVRSPFNPQAARLLLSEHIGYMTLPPGVRGGGRV